MWIANIHSRDDIRRQEIRLLQIQVDDPKTSRAGNRGFSFQRERIREEDRPAIVAPQQL